MSENIKFIVNRVNDILGTNYNLIVFNALTSEELLQILSDILSKIQEDGLRIEIKQESPEQSYVRMFTTLRILKYRPNTDSTVFRQGLVRGDADTIHPILAWLLSHEDLVRHRAYLSRFLVKVEIPSDCLDADVRILHEQYLKLVEQFKVLHKEREIGKKSGETAAELTMDLQAMSKEKEVATVRIEKMKTKATSALYMLDAARSLRMERDKERDYALQKEQEKETMSKLQISLQKVAQELQILKRNESKVTPHALIDNLTKTVTVQTAIIKEKLPLEINSKKIRIKALRAVKHSTYFGPDDATTLQLRNKLDIITKEVQNLMENKVFTNDNEKMELFRQQAGVVANVKHNLLEKLEKTNSVLKDLQDRLKEEKEHTKFLNEEIAPKGEELKKYVARLKTRSTLYKRCRAELAGLKAENGVLCRTLIILDSQVAHLILAETTFDHINSNIPDHCTPDNILSMNKQLLEALKILRSKLTSLLGDVQRLRQNHILDKQYLKPDNSHNTLQLNRTYSTADLSSNLHTLKEILQQTVEEKNRLVKRISQMQSMEKKLIQDNTFMQNNQTLKDELKSAIAAQENSMVGLKNEKDDVKLYTMQNVKETQQWQNIISIFLCKFQCAEETKQNDGIVVRTEGVETLVLQ